MQEFARLMPETVNFLIDRADRLSVAQDGKVRPFAALVIEEVPADRVGDSLRARREWIAALRKGGYTQPVTAGRIEFGPVLEGSFFFVFEFDTPSERDSQQPLQVALERALGTEGAASLVQRMKQLTKRVRVEPLTCRPDLSHEIASAR